MKICMIGADPNMLGGVSIYMKNVVEQLKRDNHITWVYPGKEDGRYTKDGVLYVSIKTKPSIFSYAFNHAVEKFVRDSHFDIINSHAIWGHWMREMYLTERIVHTYHGSTFHFYRNHFKRTGTIFKLKAIAGALFGEHIEKAPWKRADAVICVSDKVKEQLEALYGKREDVYVCRAGVDLRAFKPLKSKDLENIPKLGKNGPLGLYVGGGGYWTKGLDRTIEIGKEIYRRDASYRLWIIGSDEDKVRHLLDPRFCTLIKNIPRENMPAYYNAADVFFCMSRYEGGAPTLVTAEALASGCLVACSSDSRQEVVDGDKDVLIFDTKGHAWENTAAFMIMNTLSNKKELRRRLRNSRKLIQRFDAKKQTKNYIKIMGGKL